MNAKNCFFTVVLCIFTILCVVLIYFPIRCEQFKFNFDTYILGCFYSLIFPMIGSALFCTLFMNKIHGLIRFITNLSIINISAVLVSALILEIIILNDEINFLHDVVKLDLFNQEGIYSHPRSWPCQKYEIHWSHNRGVWATD